MELKKAMECHEQIISSLADFIKGKMNIHGEIRRYVASLGSSFKRITKVLEKRPLGNSYYATTVGESQTSPLLLRTYSQTTVKSTDEDGAVRTTTPKRRICKGKRKERTSPGEVTKEMKKRKEEPTLPAAAQKTQPSKNAEWQEEEKEVPEREEDNNAS